MRTGPDAAQRMIDDIVERHTLQAARDQPHLQMILQIIADAGLVEHDFDTVPLGRPLISEWRWWRSRARRWLPKHDHKENGPEQGGPGPSVSYTIDPPRVRSEEAMLPRKHHGAATAERAPLQISFS
jgi:hypothetical protein